MSKNTFLKRKLRDYEFLNLNLEKHVYKLPLPKIVLPATKKKIKSDVEKLEPGKYSRINMDQDEYEKLVLLKKEKNFNNIKSSYFIAMNQSIKDKKYKVFNINKDNKDNVMNFESDIANISETIVLTDSSKRLYKQNQVYTHRTKPFKRNYNMKIVKEIQYNTNIFTSGDNVNRSKINV